MNEKMIYLYEFEFRRFKMTRFQFEIRGMFLYFWKKNLNEFEFQFEIRGMKCVSLFFERKFI